MLGKFGAGLRKWAGGSLVVLLGIMGITVDPVFGWAAVFVLILLWVAGLLLEGAHAGDRAPAKASLAAPFDLGAAPPLPDMTIRDLFFHVRPDLLDDLGNEDWKVVANDVRDAFALDRLKLWGVPKPTNYLEEAWFPKERPPPELIEPSYWRKASFTFWFFQEGAEWQEHTYPDKDDPRSPTYCNLMVNRAQVLSVWPEHPAADGPNWPIHELLWALNPSGKRSEANSPEWRRIIEEVRAKLSTRVSEGGPPLLRSWGQSRWPDRPQALIPPEYWSSAKLTSEAVDGEWWEIGVTQCDETLNNQKYCRMFINKREALKVWPKLKGRDAA